MSTEGVVKAPPEHGGARPAPNLTASAAVGPSGITSSEYESPNIATAAATAKPKSGQLTKIVSAYDHKWLENFRVLKPCIKEGGVLDYSSLDGEAQKRMHSFVKDQRKWHRKRERNDSTPMTDERVRLLSEAKFNFKPSETMKAKREKEKEEKNKKVKVLAQQQVIEEAKKKAVTEQRKSNSGASAKTPENLECVERANSAKATSALKFIPIARQTLLTSTIPPSESPNSPSVIKTPASKSPKAAPKKSPAAAAPSVRKKSGKPTYLEMAHSAIVSLKDRTGSSIPAIIKWILANNQHVSSTLANTFKNRLLACIKQGVKDGRFVKVKNSYKINADFVRKQKAAAKAREVAKKKAEKQRQKELEKAKQQKELEKVNQQKKVEAEKKKADEEKKKADEEKEKKLKEKEFTPEELAEAAQKKKLKEEAETRRKEAEARRKEAEARRKVIEQQLRKRRYPIEDTKLHKEDKEWGVKPPEHVAKRPALSHTLTCLIPPHLRAATPKKGSGSVANASASGNGPLLGGNNDRGLITDAIHVYHFFCGDVGLVDADHPVPKFSLKTLLYALDEVLNGNARAAKSLPPLLAHLFVTALFMLTEPQQIDIDDPYEPIDTDLGSGELRLQKDLAKLREGLNVVSWSQICFFYMDLMERYYNSDVSLEEGVLPGKGKLDMSYFWNKDKMEEDIEIEKENGDEYNMYLGDPKGVLVKGYLKLGNQAEPWTLKADELMALLRTLTDDILATRPDLAEDIAGRGAKLNELSKAKRAAVVKYNKVRLAYEGPKKSSRQKKPDGNENKAENKKDEQADGDPKEESEKPFVPTVTQQQFLAAEKAGSKANEAYENSLNKLISRTEPIAFDRNFNAIYFFRHDPSMLHVEQLKQSSLPSEIKSLGHETIPFSSWHIIDTKPLFEQFMASLDDRGQREDEALNICSNHTILKRRLQDEKKDNTRAIAREREKEELGRRLENAKSACDADDGRRSGRLAGMARGDLKSMEEEIKQMAKTHEDEERQEKLGREKASDYSLQTGLTMVADLFAGQRATRSSKKSENDGQNEAALLANVPSHKLWIDESIGGNGTLHVLVEHLLALEKKCNELSPWTRQDITRQAWRKQLSDASYAWAIDCVMQLGPSDGTSTQDDESSEDQCSLSNPTKKQTVETASGISLANIITTFKLCLKDLELCVFEISGKKRAIEEADTAAENVGASSDEEYEELNKRQNCWKIKINALRRLPSTRYVLIRDIIIAAITVARKSHLKQVAAELKAALQSLGSSAGGKAKSAAIEVLEKHGGYDGSDDEDDDVDFNELAAANAGDVNADEVVDGAQIASLLCDEVRIISGSVGGDDFADKSDWSDAIKDCKSVSRLAVLLQSFLSKADDTLKQVKEERDYLDSILGINAKRTSRSKSGIKKHDSSTAIWCNAKLTDNLVKARVKGFPWWPAHVCIPLDLVVADALKGSRYTLVSSVGNPGMFMVDESEMVDFIEETDEDLSQYDKPTLDELHASMEIAKKLWRVKNRGVTSPWSKKPRPSFVEEKKTAH